MVLPLVKARPWASITEAVKLVADGGKKREDRKSGCQRHDAATAGRPRPEALCWAPARFPDQHFGDTRAQGSRGAGGGSRPAGYR